MSNRVHVGIRGKESRRRKYSRAKGCIYIEREGERESLTEREGEPERERWEGI